MALLHFFVFALATLASAQTWEEQQSIMVRAEALYSKAQQFQATGDIERAMEALNGVLALSPTQPQVHFEIGFIELQRGRLESAMTAWEEAVHDDPNFVSAYFNLGSVRAELAKFPEALSALNVALQLQPDSASTYKSIGIIQQKLHEHDAAISSFLQCLRLEPTNADCFCGMGNSFMKVGRIEEANRAYRSALNINNNEPGYFNNVGNLLVRHQVFNETAQLQAISFLNHAIALRPTYASAYFNLANAYSNMKMYSRSLSNMRVAAQLEPERTDYSCAIAVTMRQACEWSDFDEQLRNVEQLWEDPSKFSPSLTPPKARRPSRSPADDDHSSTVTLCPQPLEALSMDLEPSTILQITRMHCAHTQFATRASAPYFASLSMPPFPLLPPLHPATKPRLAVGFVSIELRDRPVGRDVIHLLREHSPNDICITCFSLHPLHMPGPEATNIPGSAEEWRRRLEAVCECGVFDISGMEFSRGAEVVNKEKQNVLINLDGWTSAPLINELFTLRPAPVQINFKGFAGTTGCDAVDFLAADRIVTPPEMREYYTERLLLLPHSYHYNAHIYLYPPEKNRDEDLRREDYNLPTDQFVLANFNQFYKLTPRVFHAWMQIMVSCNAHLWLLYWNPEAAQNLLAVAAEYGISESRFTFSKPFPQNLHVAIKGLADLFIDSQPYSAHGTAADALYAGVPILTLPGSLMASRVAASLSFASGLDSFVANDLDDYVHQAQQWCRPAGHRRLQAKHRNLRRMAPQTPAFDSQRWSASFYNSLRMMHELREFGVQAHVVGSDVHSDSFERHEYEPEKEEKPVVKEQKPSPIIAPRTPVKSPPKVPSFTKSQSEPEQQKQQQQQKQQSKPTAPIPPRFTKSTGSASAPSPPPPPTAGASGGFSLRSILDKAEQKQGQQ